MRLFKRFLVSSCRRVLDPYVEHYFAASKLTYELGSGFSSFWARYYWCRHRLGRSCSASIFAVIQASSVWQPDGTRNLRHVRLVFPLFLALENQTVAARSEMTHFYAIVCHLDFLITDRQPV